jgi:xanthine dehydrogenase accessory factor
MKDATMDLGLVVIKGGGDLASGVAYRLHRAGFSILITELPNPLVVRRTVAYASAIMYGKVDIAGLRGRGVRDVREAQIAMARREIAVLVDPRAEAARTLAPVALVDAIMAKENRGMHMDDAPIVIALGPGFTAGLDCHAVVETNRGHNLGRVYYQGHAEADTDEPAPMQGYTHERVLRAPRDGVFHTTTAIGQLITTQQVLGYVEDAPVAASIAGVVRGLIADGTPVRANLKVGDVDPSGDIARCFSISDKALAVGGGALEAILYLRRLARGLD